ncbi:MAG: hypothetical protein IKL42_06730 [Clostridia bacterium]|nr:hypothetical protein [Clostridia bacterium]
MKFIRSAAWLIVLAIFALNIINVGAVNEEETYTNILLKPEEFSITDTSPDCRDKIISNAESGSLFRTLRYSLYDSAIQKYNDVQPAKPMVATIEITEAGYYNIWGYAANNLVGTDAETGMEYAYAPRTDKKTKYIQIGVDETYIDTQYTSDYNVCYDWVCSSHAVYLSAGTHEINLTAPKPSAIIQLVYITNCLTLELKSAYDSGYPLPNSANYTADLANAYRTEQMSMLGAYAESKGPVPAIDPELLDYDKHGGTEKTIPNFSFSWENSTFRGSAIYEYYTLGGNAGCYSIKAPENATNKMTGLRSRDTFEMLPNRKYLISALVYTDFERTTCEASFGLSVIYNGETRYLTLKGLEDANTGEWKRVELYIDSPAEAAAEGENIQARLEMALSAFGTDDVLYVSDLHVIELPVTELVPYGAGENMTYIGSSEASNMSVEICEDSGDKITIETTGAKYVFDKVSGILEGTQLVNETRKVVTVMFNKPLEDLNILSYSDKEAILTTGEGGMTFGIQMDGMVFISTHDTDLEITCTAEIAGLWNRLKAGHLNAIDEVGGFAANIVLQPGTGRVARCEALTDIDFDGVANDTNFISNSEPGWAVKWTISSGEMLGVSVFPPKPYDWDASFNTNYKIYTYNTLPMDENGTAAKTLDTDKRTYGIDYALLWNSCYRGSALYYGNTVTPIDEEVYKFQIQSIKDAGMKSLAYIGFYAWKSGDPYEYLNEVKRHRDEYGLEGVYVDGVPDQDWMSSYICMRGLRELFPDGPIILHATGKTGNGGPPLAVPDMLIPAVDTYSTATLRGEEVVGNGTEWNYTRFITNGFNTTGVVGIQKGDAWHYEDEQTVIPQINQDIINLMSGGRARWQGISFSKYLTVLNTLEENYKLNGTDNDYFMGYYVPLVRTLAKPMLQPYEAQTVFADDFETASVWKRTDGVLIENGQLVIRDNSEALCSAEHGFTPVAGTAIAEYSFLADDEITSTQYLKDSKGNTVLAIQLVNGEIRYLDGSGGYKTASTYTSGTWNKITVKIDRISGTYELYINDILTVEDAVCASQSGIANIVFVTHKSSVGEILFDNVNVKREL